MFIKNVASNSLSELEALSAPYDNVHYVQTDLSDPINIAETLKTANVVIRRVTLRSGVLSTKLIDFQSVTSTSSCPGCRALY